MMRQSLSSSTEMLLFLGSRSALTEPPDPFEKLLAEATRTLVHKKVSNQERIEDALLVSLRPALQGLSDRRYLPICRKLLRRMPADGWEDEKLREFAEWDAEGENLVLFTLGAMCRLGLVVQDQGRWIGTEFCTRISAGWHHMEPLRFMREIWSAGVRSNLLETLDWAWACLRNTDSRLIFGKLVSEPNGFTHDEIPMTNDGISGRNMALQVVAASAALGAIWFTGWKWEPTLYGAWLHHHSESALDIGRMVAE